MANNNKKKKKASDQDIFDSKIFFAKIIKRYGIILLCAFVPLALLNYFVFGKNMLNLNQTNIVLIDIAILLVACIIGLFVFSYIDRKREENPKLKEDERDPFAD